MLNVGDTIKCLDKDDMIAHDRELAKLGYFCDFLYEKDGEKGLWLVIVETPEEDDGK